MPRTSQRSRPHSRLPNAPLAEVVFELRWGIDADDKIPPPLRRDPGYYACLDAFYAVADRLGFRVVKHVNPSPTAYSIEYRFYKSEADSFPLLQIGPGIFAVNESTAYTWGQYKSLCIDATKGLLSSYPKLRRFSSVPAQLELRYINVFKPLEGKTTGFVDFVNNSTELTLTPPGFFQSLDLGPIRAGRILMTLPLSGSKDTEFSFSLATSEVSGVQSIILESKVVG